MVGHLLPFAKVGQYIFLPCTIPRRGLHALFIVLCLTHKQPFVFGQFTYFQQTNSFNYRISSTCILCTQSRRYMMMTSEHASCARTDCAFARIAGENCNSITSMFRHQKISQIFLKL